MRYKYVFNNFFTFICRTFGVSIIKILNIVFHPLSQNRVRKKIYWNKEVLKTVKKYLLCFRSEKRKKHVRPFISLPFIKLSLFASQKARWQKLSNKDVIHAIPNSKIADHKVHSPAINCVKKFTMHTPRTNSQKKMPLFVYTCNILSRQIWGYIQVWTI